MDLHSGFMEIICELESYQPSYQNYILSYGPNPSMPVCPLRGGLTKCAREGYRLKMQLSREGVSIKDSEISALIIFFL